MKTLDYILARLGENSTWRGIIMLAALVGAKFSPDQAESIVGAGLALAALINVFRTQK